jgi:hypothetical protein
MNLLIKNQTCVYSECNPPAEYRSTQYDHRPFVLLIDQGTRQGLDISLRVRAPQWTTGRPARKIAANADFAQSTFGSTERFGGFHCADPSPAGRW